MTDKTILAIAFLAFGTIIIIAEIVVLYRKNQGFGPQAVRIVGLTIVLSIAAALTSADMPVERFTAVIGLLATLAGYLAGRAEEKSPAGAP
jgi:hypothetical protein